MINAATSERTAPIDSTTQVQTPQPFDPEGEQPFVDWLLDSSGIQLSAKEKAKYESLRGKDFAELLGSVEGFEMISSIVEGHKTQLQELVPIQLYSALVKVNHLSNEVPGNSVPIDGYSWIDNESLGFNLEGMVDVLSAAVVAGVLSDEQTAQFDAAMFVFTNPKSTAAEKAAAYSQLIQLGQAVLPIEKLPGLTEFSSVINNLDNAYKQLDDPDFFINAFLGSDQQGSKSFDAVMGSLWQAKSLGFPTPAWAQENLILLVPTDPSVKELKAGPGQDAVLSFWISKLEFDQMRGKGDVDNSEMIAMLKSIQSQMADGVKVQDVSFEAMNSSSPDVGVSELYGKISTMTAAEFEATANGFEHEKQKRILYLSFIAEIKGVRDEERTELIESDPQVLYYSMAGKKYAELGNLAWANGGDSGTLSSSHFDANGKFSNQTASATMELAGMMKVFTEAQVELLMDASRSLDVPDGSREKMRAEAETTRDQASAFLDAVQRHLSQVL